MKIKYLNILLIALFAIIMSCDKGDDDTSDYECGNYNGHQLWTGPKGGCYYINSNNNKTYVDRSYCNCK